MSGSLARTWAFPAVLAAWAVPAHGQQLPEHFEATTVVSGLQQPAGLAFAPDGRLFVAERAGVVRVVENGVVCPEPFIDLRDEVNGQGDRGLLGLALDPEFATSPHVYLLYTVDPIFGEPDEIANWPTFVRLTRYTGTAASNGGEADPASRLVLIGGLPSEGIPNCAWVHSAGGLVFGHDGTLFVAAGEGATFFGADSGGRHPVCFQPPLFEGDEDVGAFRAQYLGSLAGKVLRIDPVSGLGLPDNPHWTGDGADNASRVWASGLRNPFRLAARPGSPPPGTLYVGDVGWERFEEISVVRGGENLGWPCFEAVHQPPDYNGAEPAHSGCDTLETPENPGPLTPPLVWWHHNNPAFSFPSGIKGRAAAGCAFAGAGTYPAPYGGALFYADFMGETGSGWIRAIETDGDDRLVAWHGFAQLAGPVVDLAAEPGSAALHYVLLTGEVVRVDFVPPPGPGDVNGDGDVDVADLVEVILSWGPCADPPAGACPADLDGSGEVDVDDLVTVVLHWT